MNRLALLFCAIVAAHVLPTPLSLFYGEPQEWFYILRGIEGVVVFALLLLEIGRPIKRDRVQSVLVGAVCVWAAFEESLTAICGTSYLVAPYQVAKWQGLCDASTGLPLSLITIGAALALAAFIQERQRARSKQ